MKAKMNCEKCPIKSECDKWFRQAVKEKIFKRSEREFFCPLTHASIQGLISYLGQVKAKNILISIEDKQK